MVRKTVSYESENRKAYRITKVYLFGILIFKKTHEISEIELAAIQGC